MRTKVQYVDPAKADEAGELLDLAQGFRAAAERTRPGRGSKLARAPYELLCLHSVDLALGAALLASDFDAPTVRAMGNDVSRRARALQLHRIGWGRHTLATIEALTRHRQTHGAPFASGATEQVALPRIAAMVDDAIEKCAAFVEGCKLAEATNGPAFQGRIARRA